MGFGYHSTQRWPNRKAIVISGTTTPPDDEIRERLGRRDWQLIPGSFTVERAVKMVLEKKASFILVEDSPQMPTPYVLRQLMRHKLAYLTPIMATTTETNSKEKVCFSSLLPAEIVSLPMVPAKFVEMFEWVVHRWSIDSMADLRGAGQLFLDGNVQSCLKTLMVLANNSDLAPFAAACLALFFREHRDVKTAEKMLLSSLKQSPRSMAVIMGLVDLYLNSAMPYMAKRLLKSANANYAQPAFLAIDSVQAHLMLNEMEETIPFFQTMIEKNFLGEMAKTYLLRVLYATGDQKVFQKLATSLGVTLDYFQRAWSKQEVPLKNVG